MRQDAAHQDEVGNGGIRIVVALGTRPEAIKLAPVVRALRGKGFRVTVLATGQHREQLSSALRVFGLTADVDLDVMTDRQTLAELVRRVTPGAGDAIRSHKPSYVVVQGDTISAFCVALAAFFERVPIAHVEAGLRSGSLHDPFPEEASRRMTDAISDLDLAPTPLARTNLMSEGKEPSRIVVTGQTGVDAIRLAAASTRLPEGLAGRRLVTVTMHRRENWPLLASLADGLRVVAGRHPDLTFVYPMHRNPVVRDAVRPALGDCPNFILDEPYDYGSMAALMQASELIVTDSGGMLEEGVSLGRHVAVLRNVTERPEGIDKGLATLVGTDSDRMVEKVDGLLREESARRSLSAEVESPYGDGAAAARVAQAIAWQLGFAERPEDWVPAT